MKKNVLLIIALFCFISSRAQYFQWAKQFVGGGSDNGNSIYIDPSGNIYIIGSFFGPIDTDPGPGTNYLSPSAGEDIFIIKLDPTGSFLWANKIGGTGQDRGKAITVDGSGNVVITGSYSGTVDFDPGVGVVSKTANGAFPDIFIVKYDANGNYLWVKSIGSTADDAGAAILTDASGNVYSTGFVGNEADFDPGAGTVLLNTTNSNEDAYVLKLDASGNYAWAATFGGAQFNYFYGNSLAKDVAGCIYTIGHFSGSGDFDPGAGNYPLTSAGSSNDVFVTKLDQNGNFRWAKSFGSSTGADFGMAIAVAGNTDVYTTGYFYGSGDFDPGAGTSNMSSPNGYDIYVSKMDSAGTFIWAKNFEGPAGDDYATGITLDATGDVYTTGWFFETVDFDPGAGTAAVSAASAAYSDIFVSKLDASGNYVWAKAMGGGDTDVAYSIALDGQDRIYTTGSFYLTADFDPAATTYNLTAASGSNVFISVLNQCTVFPDVELGADVSGCLNNYFAGVSTDPQVTYSWSSNPPFFAGTNATEMVVPQPAGASIEYYLYGVNTTTGCAAMDSINIDIDSISLINLGSDIHSCSPLSISIGIPDEPNVSYSWTSNPPGFTDNTGEPTVSPALDVPTTYYVVATHASGGCVRNDTIVVGYHTGPSWVGSGQTVPLCQGDSIVPSDYLQINGGTAPYTINWWNGPNNWYTVDFTYIPTTSLNFTVTLSDVYGCTPASAGVLFVPVNGPNRDLVGHVTTPLPADVDNGLVYAFRYQPGAAGFDTVGTAPLNANGEYNFIGMDNGSYLIKAIADETDFPLLVPTYYGDAFQWDSSVVVNHGCIQIDTADIEMIELPLTTGPGVVSGYVLEGDSFGVGARYNGHTGPIYPCVPGGPLKGIDVKLGKNPGGGIQARVMTDSTGFYQFTNLPLLGYRIYVDIPNLPMDSTREIILDAGNNISAQNNYYADSASVYVLDTLVAVGIHASRNVYENNFSIYPNPAKNNLFASFDLNKTSDVNIEFTNTLGQLINAKTIRNASAGTFTYKFDLTSLNLKAGIYFISILNDNKKYTQRLVVME